MPKPQEDQENWLPVVGWEGFYEVSDHGRVRSLERFVASLGDGNRGPYRRKIKSRIISTKKGHPYFVAPLARDGEVVLRRIHSLVLEAFVGPLPKGNVTRHLNGVFTDNRLANLAYGTRAENWADFVRHNPLPGATKTHLRKEAS